MDRRLWEWIPWLEGTVNDLLFNYYLVALSQDQMLTENGTLS